ncbi:MAG TPA: ATP-binding protein [Blastocatellia bacterium]|nr:ATP-binding protein [Blastocatellia bacterium]
MTAEQLTHKPEVLLDPCGLRVGVGSRVAYLFDRPADRTRFAPFIAEGLRDGDKCVIITDRQGKQIFSEALDALGVSVPDHETDESLVIITGEVSTESMEAIAIPVLKDARARFRFIRAINDTGWMSSEGWTPRDFLRLEVKGHLLMQRRPCTIICQYDTTRIHRSGLEQIIAAHEYTIAGADVERNPDRRPLGQLIFDSMDEQLRVLTRLQNLSLNLTATHSLDERLDYIIEAAITICRADRAAISYFDEAGELRIMRHHGLSDDYLSRRRLTRSDPSIARMIASSGPTIIQDIEQLKNISTNYDNWKRSGIRAIVTLPLISDGEVFGAISTGSGTEHHFSQTEIDAMSILAAQASAAITNARLFEQLHEASRAKDDFLANLSHELRTPLTPILGWMHILRPLAATSPLLAQGLETIERNARQQAGLINDLLDLTRIISGKMELTREPKSLDGLVAASVDQVRQQAEARRIKLVQSLPDESIVCNIDTVRIQQVLANLLNNAVKFTPDEGEIRISLSLVDRSDQSYDAQIEVTDTGIGIAPEFLPHVFDRFAQAHSGINQHYGGLGLGLAITRAMVEMHGGKVEARSEGLGHGSRFIVKLPCARIEDGAGPEHAKGAAIEQASRERLGLRVLVIEDSLDTLDMLKLWLDSYGCDVMMATGGAEALRLAADRPLDLIISDIGLPQIDGYELIRKLRKMAYLESVPAIALTGYAREEDRELALAAGYDAHLAKPAEIRSLLYLVKKLTKK